MPRKFGSFPGRDDYVLPDWADRSSFPGTLLHAGEFRNVDEVRGKNVLVYRARELQY